MGFVTVLENKIRLTVFHLFGWFYSEPLNIDLLFPQMVNEIERQKKSRSDRRQKRKVIYVPDRFTIWVNSNQYQPLNSRWEKSIQRELKARIKEFISSRQYQIRNLDLTLTLKSSLQIPHGKSKVDIAFSSSDETDTILYSQKAKKEIKKTKLDQTQSINLELIKGNFPKRAWIIRPGDQISIGREKGNVIQLDQDNISAHHATIGMSSEGTLFITDEQSSNGSFVNDKEIKDRVQLKIKDQIRLCQDNPIVFKLTE